MAKIAALHQVSSNFFFIPHPTHGLFALLWDFTRQKKELLSDRVRHRPSWVCPVSYLLGLSHSGTDVPMCQPATTVTRAPGHPLSALECGSLSPKGQASVSLLGPRPCFVSTRGACAELLLTDLGDAVRCPGHKLEAPDWPVLPTHTSSETPTI